MPIRITTPAPDAPFAAVRIAGHMIRRVRDNTVFPCTFGAKHADTLRVLNASDGRGTELQEVVPCTLTIEYRTPRTCEQCGLSLLPEAPEIALPAGRGIVCSASCETKYFRAERAAGGVLHG